MANNNQSGQDRNQGGTTMADRASDLKDRAGELLQGGMLPATEKPSPPRWPHHSMHALPV